MGKKHEVKALGMFSGGLDSLLATKLVQNQGIAVTGLHFTAPFIHPFTQKEKLDDVQRWAEKLGVELRIIPLGIDYLEIIKNPRYGLGKNLNPCVDCKIFMFRLALKIMEEENFAFVFSGEVLGQRPKSQRRDMLFAISKRSDLQNRLLRPLSAKLLPISWPEQEGIIDREQLLDFSGRSRGPQLELADKLDIYEPPGSGGGCLLTDANYSARLRQLLATKLDINADDLELLTIGRHLALPNGKIIVSRNEKENEWLERFSSTASYILKPDDWPGPTALLIGSTDRNDIEIAAGCILRYGKPQGEKLVTAACIDGKTEFTISTLPLDDRSIHPRFIHPESANDAIQQQSK